MDASTKSTLDKLESLRKQNRMTAVKLSQAMSPAATVSRSTPTRTRTSEPPRTFEDAYKYLDRISSSPSAYTPTRPATQLSGQTISSPSLSRRESRRQREEAFQEASLWGEGGGQSQASRVDSLRSLIPTTQSVSTDVIAEDSSGAPFRPQSYNARRRATRSPERSDHPLPATASPQTNRIQNTPPSHGPMSHPASSPQPHR